MKVPIIIQKSIKKIIFQAAKQFNVGVSIYKIDNKLTNAGIFANIGAGSFAHPDWVNVDKFSDFYRSDQGTRTVNYDLLERLPLPFQNDSVDIIYTEHVIEHIDDNSALHLFKEVFKKLKKGGVVRISCPDMDYLFKSYQRGDKEIFFKIKDYGNRTSLSEEEYHKLPDIDASIQQLLLWAFARQASIHHNMAKSPLDDAKVEKIFSSGELENAFEYCVKVCSLEVQKLRPEEHINWWTERKLIAFLRSAGFQIVNISRRGQSIAPQMRNKNLFDTTCPHLSLYVEAVK